MDNIKCFVSCPFFPNMECESKDWEYDESKGYKVRKEKKVFCCEYDNSPIDWHRDCPRLLERFISAE